MEYIFGRNGNDQQLRQQVCVAFYQLRNLYGPGRFEASLCQTPAAPSIGFSLIASSWQLVKKAEKLGVRT